MMGIFAISGSLCTRLINVVMACTPSSNASSILISNTCAPFSTCWRATLNASSYLFSLIKRANFFEPVTLVRSPILIKFVSGRTTSGSNPDKRRYGFMTVGFDIIFLSYGLWAISYRLSALSHGFYSQPEVANCDLKLFLTFLSLIFFKLSILTGNFESYWFPWLFFFHQ